jgi:hypothetical protein
MAIFASSSRLIGKEYRRRFGQASFESLRSFGPAAYPITGSFRQRQPALLIGLESGLLREMRKLYARCHITGPDRRPRTTVDPLGDALRNPPVKTVHFCRAAARRHPPVVPRVAPLRQRRSPTAYTQTPSVGLQDRHEKTNLLVDFIRCLMLVTPWTHWLPELQLFARH